ncbi:MAG: carbohydrate ABC transporter permease [Lachnospiraceae bacterium]|nr:carbohydrate ABC transporter permease [Lachnospiraceae bacterium]MBR5731972.1 carbohydrate ABC transporter permease [Lachnospiraceae bacterium]
MAKTLQEKLDAKAEKAYYRRHRSNIKLTGKDIAFYIVDYAVFGLFALICFFPFYYLFINTISDNEMVARGAVNFYPIGFTLQNYKDMLSLGDLGQAFLVTISRTVIGTLLMVVASAYCGYLVTKKEMWNRKFWYRFLVITMYFNAGLIPGYTNMLMLGLTDNFLGYIIPAIVQPFNIILVKTYIESIPAELEESAFIDGAGHMMIFRKLIWPLSKPILATIAIFGAVGHWNSFMDSVINMQNSPNLHTLQHKLYIWLNQSNNIASTIGTARSADEMAAIVNKLNSGKVIKYTISMVTVLPILLVYPWMQKYFEKGIMLGAVKG